jgi:hypothetical protein
MTRTLTRLRDAIRKTSVKAGVVGALCICAATTLATAPSASAVTLATAPSASSAVPTGYSTTLAGAEKAATKAPITESPDSSSTCGGTYYFDFSETQIDNCPGNGAASWAWVYSPTAGSAVSGYLQKSYINITFVNGTTGSLTAKTPSTNTGNWYGSGKQIGGFSLCEQLLTANFLIVYRCSVDVALPA